MGDAASVGNRIYKLIQCNTNVGFDRHAEVETLGYNRWLHDYLAVWRNPPPVVGGGTPACLPEAACEGIVIAPPVFLLLEVKELLRTLGGRALQASSVLFWFLLFSNVKVDVV